MLRTSEANVHLLMQAAAECGESVLVPVDVARAMAADILDAHRKQRAIDEAVDRLEDQMTSRRSA